ncbi:Rib/alpha-like domain-containing protein, partial [Streptococcus mitis]|uniref:Rib/alpha-like domain-containing protein n=1 Tax=Streptococcus mitis TaxID=28037 RepID=UPI0039C135EE
MENKSNSLSRVERHQREKVLRFSIRKYSFGAASVAVAALMFLGARVASADSVIENNSQNTTDVVKQKDKDKSLAEIQQPTDNKLEAAQNPSEKEMATNIESVVKVVDKANLRKVVEELNATLSSKSNLDNSVISPIKDRVQKGQALLDSDTATQKDVNDLLSLLENDLTVLSNATKESSKVQETTTENKTEIRDNKTASELSEADKTISDKKESLKLSAEQLQAAVLELPEHESTKEVFEKANELLGLAQGVIQNTTISPNDIEDLTKRVKRMFNSVKNATTRLNSGKRDTRNGQSMESGTSNRAAAVSQNWTSERNLLSYQRFRASDFNGNLQNGNRQFTENKVDMTARFETINGSKYVVYDVFFNNDGRVMGGATHEVFYKLILQPEILDLNPNGTYKSDTLRDMKFEIYQKNGDVGTLSQNPGNFSKKQTVNFNFLTEDSVTREGLTYKNTLDIRHNGSYGLDMKDTFKSNRNDPFLTMAVSRNGVYSKWSYGFGVTTLNDRDAVHMQVKAKLKQGVTEEKVKEAYTLAVAGTQRPTTNQSYVFVSGKNASENYTNVPDRPVVPTVQQSEEYPIKGKEVTKTVGEAIENVSNPVSSGFVVRNDNTTHFPSDVRWSWPNGQPNTNTAGVFNYRVTANYYDNSSNSTTVTLKVKPKKPVIEQNSVNEKAGKTGQNVVVTVQDGVPEGSTVILYNGTNIIGRGRTSGRTATINVSGALPSTSITAKTIVGGVESDLSNPVKPTEVPDKQPPTVSINGNRLTANENDNRFIIYRGANFNPRFRVQDDKNNVTLSITNLPEGVKNVSTSGSKDLSYTIPDNYVADNASLGERTATVVASDGRNSATYKFKYRIVDVQAKNSTTENRILGSTLGDPHAHFKVAESNTVENDKYYPTGMQFKWKEIDLRNARITDVADNTKLNELGTITKYTATAVFPGVKNTKEIDRVNYTIYSPTQKAIPITFNVTDNVKPTVKLVQNNQDTTLSESTTTNALPKVTVYRGEKAEITVKSSDNTGKLSRFATSGLPSGVTETGASSSDSATDAAPLAHTLSGKVATNTALGDKVLTVVASDKTTPTNTTTVKFKLDVKAQNEKYTPTAGTTPVAVNNIGNISPSDLEKIKNSVTVPNLSQEARNSGGVTTSLKNHGAVTTAGGKKYVTVEVTYPDGSKDEVPVEVQQNTNVVKRPIINLKQGETLSAAEMKTIVELQDGSSKLPLPADAVVTATFNTNTVKDGNWTNITVRFNGGTTKTVSVNYNVKATFPVANTVYDFRGVTRTNDSESNYYINKGLPNGMNWFVKKGTETKPNAKIQTYLATDGLGKTDYTFGAYYAASRFNDNESNINLKLKHEGTVSHHVYDVMAAANKITVNNGATLTEANAKAAVTKVAGSEDLPAGTTYEWVADENGTALTNKTVTEFGEAIRYVKVTLPKSQETSDNSPAATQRQSSKIIRVTVKVNETVKPTVKLVQNNQDTTLSESTPEARVPKVTVYRGEKAEITVKASDNTGKLSRFATSGLPSGVTETGASSSDSATDAAPLAHTLSGKVATNTALGDKVLTVVASDKTTPTNTTTVKFKLDVKAQNEKYTPTAGTTVKVGNIGTISQPDEDKIKNAVTVPALSEEATRDGVTKRLKDNGRVTAKNGKNYVTVEVVYPDGSKDEVDVAVEEVLKAGEKNPTNPAVEGQPYTSKEKVINPNKDDATFTATPTNGLTVGTDGKVTGKPTGIKWTGDETSKTVNIPVTVSRTGDTPVTVTIPVVVQRDLDGDGKPDVSDDDIDGDGIPNDQDPAPRVKDGLTAGKVNPTNPAVEGQPYTSKEKVINPNKDDATFTATPTNGLTVGTDGKVTGKPTGIEWTGDETEKTVNIPVTVSRTGDTPVTVTIPVVVQRDLDGDGKPDVSDDDIDGDGIPNDQDPAPRVKDGLTAGKVNPTNPAVEGQPYTSKEKVINPNKDDATFTATPTNGLTVGTDGKVTGKPTGITWTGDETSKTVNIPVTVTRTGD